MTTIRNPCFTSTTPTNLNTSQPSTSLELTTEVTLGVTTEEEKIVTTLTSDRNTSLTTNLSLEYDYDFKTRICSLAGKNRQI